jgi:hypothetical protein
MIFFSYIHTFVQYTKFYILYSNIYVYRALKKQTHDECYEGHLLVVYDPSIGSGLFNQCAGKKEIDFQWTNI